ncbi:uncharacterized protein Dvir_GJ25613 [Drosophila virilis]|uniref:Pre-C2HC domain-containing protein n=1 Tax=Drosophila virilis TaxID=7244 RepID=A0A0Q9WEU4_DROVI|nr:uncharacterized protein Dvir_GJ25613 [Drosophila virilis]
MATNNRPQNNEEIHSPIYPLPNSSIISPTNIAANVDRLDGSRPLEDFYQYYNNVLASSANRNGASTSLSAGTQQCSTWQPQQHGTVSTTTATTTTTTASSSSGCRTSASTGTSRAALEPIGTRPKAANPTLQSTPYGTQAAGSCVTNPPLPPIKNAGATLAFEEPLVDWQTVSAKKRRGTTLLSEGVKKGKQLNNRNTSRAGAKPATPSTASAISNRYASLEPQEDASVIDDGEMDTADEAPPVTDQQQSAKKISKPRPITVPGVSDIVAMERTIDQAVGADAYEFKVSPSGYLRIYAKDADTHRAIVRKLTEVRVQFTHFCLKEDRPYRVVVKNLAASTPRSQIEAAFTSHGHIVTNLYNPGARQPTSDADSTNDFPSRNFWFVDLKQSLNNREALRLNKVGRQRVTIELPRKNNSIRQCFRCFEFDHTKNYCLKQPKCGRCGQSHWTNSEQCQAKTVADLRCSNCEGNHAASYKGCKSYQVRLNARQPAINVSPPTRYSHPQNTRRTTQQFVPSRIVQQGLSYADALRPGHHVQVRQPPARTLQPTVNPMQLQQPLQGPQEQDASLGGILQNLQQSIAALNAAVATILVSIKELKDAQGSPQLRFPKSRK